ncbi:MAG TPA: zf-HC2 domain-containing protein [Ilumatobacteraceae bacterium]|nr:zf-HC2 domain-containing protein [Ilumatobacteraceae bacterium]
MTDCNDAMHELHTYLDHEMSDTDSELVRTHLAGCKDCAEAFEFHSQLRVTIRRKCRNDELPPGLIARIERCFNEDFDGDGRIG